MNVMSRAKVYEELKELRRQGGMDSEIQGVQGLFAALIKGLDAADVAPDESASAVRILDIRTLPTGCSAMKRRLRPGSIVQVPHCPDRNRSTFER